MLLFIKLYANSPVTAGNTYIQGVISIGVTFCKMYTSLKTRCSSSLKQQQQQQTMRCFLSLIYSQHELTEAQAFPHSKWCGHLKSHLNYWFFMRKILEFAPQQIPGTQSQLGGLVGLVGGRWKTW